MIVFTLENKNLSLDSCVISNLKITVSEGGDVNVSVDFIGMLDIETESTFDFSSDYLLGRRLNFADCNAFRKESSMRGTSSITLIDDSSVAAATLNGGVKVYNLVSGSIDGGVYNPAAPHYYGLVYPQYGSIVLDGNVLDQRIAFKTGLGTSIEANNHFALFRSISGSATQINTTTGDLYGFMARNSETISSTHYFVRVKNAEYNFSNNPSYVTGSVGQIAQSTFVNDPKTYITTVGLYNDNQELLAVAKLSKPLLKSFQRESLIRVRLDF